MDRATMGLVMNLHAHASKVKLEGC